MTFTTTAFHCSSSWLFGVFSCKTTPKDLPSSSAQHALPRFLTQADRFICGVAPSITARYCSSCPSDSTSRWTPCPPKNCKRRLQVHLGCVWLSPSCPFRLLHTFRFLRPATLYRRFWIRRPSSERRRDFNPPDQCAAPREIPSPVAPTCFHFRGQPSKFSKGCPVE